MFGALFRRQSRRDETSRPAAATPERREIPYDPALVPTLTHQHRLLTLLLVKANSAAQLKRYDEVREALVQFRTGLTDHLKKESAELHPYLYARLTGEGSDAILKEMRANTRYIERAVETFLDHYFQYPVGDKTIIRFGMELSGVSEEFCERIEKEEASVYTLYLPPEAY